VFLHLNVLNILFFLISRAENTDIGFEGASYIILSMHWQADSFSSILLRAMTDPSQTVWFWELFLIYNSTTSNILT